MSTAFAVTKPVIALVFEPHDQRSLTSTETPELIRRSPATPIVKPLSRVTIAAPIAGISYSANTESTTTDNSGALGVSSVSGSSISGTKSGFGDVPPESEHE